MMEYTGQGVPKNLGSALRHLEDSCNKGNPNGCMAAGITAEELKDIGRATGFYTRACKSGVDMSCELLRKVQTGGRGALK